jgi:hypothetical protein
MRGGSYLLWKCLANVQPLKWQTTKVRNSEITSSCFITWDVQNETFSTDWWCSNNCMPVGFSEKGTNKHPESLNLSTQAETEHKSIQECISNLNLL